MKNVFHVFLRMFTKFLGERPSKLAVFLCVALFASTTAFAEEYITDVMVIGGDKDRVDFLKDSCGAQGWTVIDKDLNDNAGVGTDYVYLLYKKSSKGGGSNGFITDFIIKTDDYPDSYIFNGRTYYRIPHKGSEHFEIHGGNLNSGTVSSSTNMRLYYTKEEFPDRRFVRDIAFTDAKLKSGYTTLGRNGAVVGSDGSGAMDLNEGAGSSSDYIYMHFATVSSSMDNPEYISDVVVLGGSKDEVNALKERYASRGWIVIDQDLNDNAGAGTDYIYMAYKKSHFSDVNKGFITDFIIKTGDHPDSFTFNGRTYYRAPNFGDGNFAIYGGNLNSGTVSSSTNMWLYFTRESFPDTRVVSDIAFTVDEKTLKGYTTLGENGAAVGSDGSGAMDLNEGAGSSSDYIYMHFATAPWWNGDLSILTSDGSYVAEDGYVLKGKLASNSKISIAKGASVTLKDVTINGGSDKNNKYKWAGINCLGDCNIILEGENSVKGFWEDYPGIHVLEGGTLTIEGDGSLDARSNGFGAGIGGGDGINCGNIVINAGTVTATGGIFAAGIGSGYLASAGDITITDGVTLVTATKGEFSPNSIGLGLIGNSVGKISIGGVFVDGISESPYTFQTYDVVFNANGGTGSMEKQHFVYDAEPTVLTKNTFTREGYTFVGWNTKADGSGTTYADEEKVRNLTDEAGGKVTLYAQWGMPYIDGNGKEQIKQSGEYIVLTGTTDVSTLSSGWYVVMGEVTYENSFDFAGKDVHLILADGAKLTVVNNRADAKTEFNNLSIYAQSKDDKMGAFVVNSSNGDAIKVGENFVINGGVVTAAGSVDAKVFLAGGSAKANGYKGSVSVKDGLFYTDGKGNSYTAGENGSINVVDFNGENVTSSFSLNMIAGKNMHPYIPAIQFKKYVKSDGSEGTLAELNANYNEIVPFGISAEMTVDSVEFKREFTTVTNGYATVIFPFDVQANNLEGVETVVAFGGVNKQYQVLMNVVWDKNKPSDFTLKAHTPYMVHMNKPTLTIHGPVTLKPIKEKTYEVEIGNWKFIGTYVFKEWSANDKDLGHAYGYTTVSTNNFSAGQFVIIAKNAITRAFRAYLVETQPQAIVARKPSQSNAGSQIVTSSSNSRPDYMDVIIVDKDEDGKEHTTVIGRFNTRTGEIKLNPVGNRVYDLKGRTIRKDAKKAKGAYYGKKVGIPNQGKI